MQGIQGITNQDKTFFAADGRRWTQMKSKDIQNSSAFISLDRRLL
jgi:hypothetical protein